jgi:serine/threonine protein kinase
MFKKEAQLGEGAYGTVYRVKSLYSFAVDISVTQRIILDKTNQLRRKFGLPLSEVKPQKHINHLLKDQVYVIKVIDLQNLPDDGKLEALLEIELMQQLHCPYIVGFYDAFVQDEMINLVLEYC